MKPTSFTINGQAFYNLLSGIKISGLKEVSIGGEGGKLYLWATGDNGSYVTQLPISKGKRLESWQSVKLPLLGLKNLCYRKPDMTFYFEDHRLHVKSAQFEVHDLPIEEASGCPIDIQNLNKPKGDKESSDFLPKFDWSLFKAVAVKPKDDANFSYQTSGVTLLKNRAFAGDGSRLLVQKIRGSDVNYPRVTVGGDFVDSLFKELAPKTKTKKAEKPNLIIARKNNLIRMSSPDANSAWAFPIMEPSSLPIEKIGQIIEANADVKFSVSVNAIFMLVSSYKASTLKITVESAKKSANTKVFIETDGYGKMRSRLEVTDLQAPKDGGEIHINLNHLKPFLKNFKDVPVQIAFATHMVMTVETKQVLYTLMLGGLRHG